MTDDTQKDYSTDLGRSVYRAVNEIASNYKKQYDRCYKIVDEYTKYKNKFINLQARYIDEVGRNIIDPATHSGMIGFLSAAIALEKLYNENDCTIPLLRLKVDDIDPDVLESYLRLPTIDWMRDHINKRFTPATEPAEKTVVDGKDGPNPGQGDNGGKPTAAENDSSEEPVVIPEVKQPTAAETRWQDISLEYRESDTETIYYKINNENTESLAITDLELTSDEQTALLKTILMQDHKLLKSRKPDKKANERLSKKLKKISNAFIKRFNITGDPFTKKRGGMEIQTKFKKIHYAKTPMEMKNTSQYLENASYTSGRYSKNNDID